MKKIAEAIVNAWQKKLQPRFEVFKFTGFELFSSEV